MNQVNTILFLRLITMLWRRIEAIIEEEILCQEVFKMP